MKITLVLVAILAVLLGVTAGSFIESSIMNKDITAPLTSSDHVSEDQIKVYGDSAAISLSDKNLRWSRYANTNSMLPLLDEGYNGLEFVPTSEDEIHIGDVISFNYNDKNYVHRVIEIGNDVNGWYAITKGDSNDFIDEGKRRFEDVKGVLIGVIF